MTGPANILRRLEQAGPSDRELLACFVAERDQAAFAELVRRHGPFVLGVCRRVAGHVQDAEDAFQAVFLVLARKARKLGNSDLLANWLYGVAVRVALRARRSAVRRRAREVAVSILPDPPAESPSVLSDLGPVLDEELAALPSWYREAILLCDLRGLSREEAATLLGVPEGTLSSRLANGRKKLAARLMKRGVSLSIATLPMSMGQAEAGFAAPDELVSKTCALVANWSAGRVVPEPFANLAGGLAMRKTLMLCAVVVMAVAGAVIAAGTAEGPASAGLPQAAPVAKASAAPLQKHEAEPAEKPVLTTRPRLRLARDYRLTSSGEMAWSPDGKMLALQGFVNQGPEKGDNLLHLDCDPFDPRAARPTIPLNKGVTFVGFTPDGSRILTAQREYQLVSGFHRLQYMDLTRGKDGLSVNTEPGLTVDLDADNTEGYSLAADGKTYRTLEKINPEPTVMSKVRVSSVDASTGRTLETLMTAEGAIVAVTLSPRGERLAILTAKGDVTVYDVDRGKSLWTKSGVTKLQYPFAGQSILEFSGNPGRLLLLAYRQPPVILNVESGELLPALENVQQIVAFTNRLSPDGGLLFLCGDHSRPARKDGIATSNDELGRYMSVWDTNSGKLLKQWARHIPSAAVFHPTKPILAILEPNGENTSRLGLWDFSAEVGKK